MGASVLANDFIINLEVATRIALPITNISPRPIDWNPGLRTISTPIKPKTMANHLRIRDGSAKKIIAPIERYMGTVKLSTVASASGIMVIAINQQIIEAECITPRNP